MKIAKKLLTWC